MQLSCFHEEDQERFRAYALGDARACLEIWLGFSKHWPAHERRLSDISRTWATRGVALDQEKARAAVAVLDKECGEAEALIPWARRSPPTSKKELYLACYEKGIEPPASTNDDDPGFLAWRETHGAGLPFVDAVGRWRRANRTRKVIEQLLARVRPDGRVATPLKYFGAGPGRWSGADGLNFQNLNREPVCGVKVRELLRAAPGHALVVADLSQIEPRCLAWLSGDARLLESLRKGTPLYEAHARATMDWTGGALKKEDPNLYSLAKARVLGLGYGCGAAQFVHVAKIMAGLDITQKDAQAIVANFRRTNSAITALWDTLNQRIYRDALEARTMHTISLPSGRVLRYFNPYIEKGDKVRAAVVRGENAPALFWHGAKLTENLVQATARDVFASGLVRVHARGLPILWTVHDEVILEVPEDQAQEALDATLGEMRVTPAWMPGLPLEAEGEIMEAYRK